MSLESLGPFNLPPTYVAGAADNTFTVISSGQFGNQPGQLGTIVLYNFSSYVIGLNSSSDGQLLDLQPGTGNIYDAPTNNGALVAVVKGGSAGTNAPQLTGQVALYGEQIGGSWPETLAVPPATSMAVGLGDFPLGQNWSYVLPSAARWVGFYAVYSTSSTPGNRYLAIQAIVPAPAPLVSPLGGGTPLTEGLEVNVSAYANAEGLVVPPTPDTSWVTGVTPDLFLPALSTLEGSVAGLDPGDQWHNVLIVLSPN